jgi:hypothetical protein
MTDCLHLKLSAVLILLLALSGCAIKRIHLTSHEDVLDKLGYVGPHRAVYLIGSSQCYTNDDTQEFPQADLRCY